MAHHQIKRRLSCPCIVNLLYFTMWFIIITNVWGCVSVKNPFKPTYIGQKFQLEKTEDPQNATIYLYRPQWFVAALDAPMITINGEEVLSLRNGGYTKIQILAGEYTFETRSRASSMKYWYDDHHVLNLEQGLTYFIQIVPSFGFEADYFNIALVDEQDALKEISDLDYLSPRKEFYKSDHNYKTVCKVGKQPTTCSNETKHFHDISDPQDTIKWIIWDIGVRSFIHK